MAGSDNVKEDYFPREHSKNIGRESGRNYDAKLDVKGESTRKESNTRKESDRGGSVNKKRRRVAERPPEENGSDLPTSNHTKNYSKQTRVSKRDSEKKQVSERMAKCAEKSGRTDVKTKSSLDQNVEAFRSNDFVGKENLAQQVVGGCRSLAAYDPWNGEGVDYGEDEVSESQGVTLKSDVNTDVNTDVDADVNTDVNTDGWTSIDGHESCIEAVGDSEGGECNDNAMESEKDSELGRILEMTEKWLKHGVDVDDADESENVVTVDDGLTNELIDNVKKVLDLMKGRMAALETENSILATNISALYMTAQQEIGRKETKLDRKRKKIELLRGKLKQFQTASCDASKQLLCAVSSPKCMADNGNQLPALLTCSSHSTTGDTTADVPRDIGVIADDASEPNMVEP